jgi:sigma-E factor negative regulatory protein RseA
MTDPVKEQLSACLDGELPEAELDLLLKQVQRDARLQQSVGRYALISEVLRTGATPVASAGFASRISQAIAAEANDQTAPVVPAAPRQLPRWVRPVGGAAIAASVAAVAVMLLQPQVGPQPQTEGTTPIIAGNAPEVASDRYIVPPEAPTTQIVPAAYLAKYVMAHSEFVSPLGRRAVFSSVLSDDESELSESADMSTPAAADQADEDQTEPPPITSIQPQR